MLGKYDMIIITTLISEHPFNISLSSEPIHSEILTEVAKAMTSRL